MHKTLYDISRQQLEKCKTLIERIRVRKRDVSPGVSETASTTKQADTQNTGKPSGKTEKEDDPFCRICYSQENPVGALDDLVSPCGCKGTIKYVHRYCLRIWRFKGKMVKDIKVCEQCFCEYIVDDEKHVARAVIVISTVAIMLSLLVLTSIFVSSSADTVEFIANDIYAYLYDRPRIVSFDRPIIICNMDAVLVKKIKQNPAREAQYTLHRIETANGETDHFASVKKKYIYSLKNIHLLDFQTCDAFTSVAVLGLAYTIMFEETPILFVNFALSFWRIMSFARVLDWCLYGTVILYIYSRIFEKIYGYIDNYFRYVANLY